MKGYVTVSWDWLYNICLECINNIESYSGEDDVIYYTTRFSFFKMRFVTKEVRDPPAWVRNGKNVAADLRVLVNQCEYSCNDEGLSYDNKTFKLSIDCHEQLIKLKEKSDSFNYFFLDY